MEEMMVVYFWSFQIFCLIFGIVGLVNFRRKRKNDE